MKSKYRWGKFSRVKCNCGHYPKDHFAREGCCHKCGCTWYYPNDRYILRKAREKLGRRKVEKVRKNEMDILKFFNPKNKKTQRQFKKVFNELSNQILDSTITEMTLKCKVNESLFQPTKEIAYRDKVLTVVFKNK